MMPVADDSMYLLSLHFIVKVLNHLNTQVDCNRHEISLSLVRVAIPMNMRVRHGHYSPFISPEYKETNSIHVDAPGQPIDRINQHAGILE